MHLFDKLRASLRRKPHKIELTLSQQIEKLLNQSNVEEGDHRLRLLSLVYEHRSRQFHLLNVPPDDSKRMEFERSMLKSLLAITSSSSCSSSSSSSSSSTSPSTRATVNDRIQSTFQRSSRLYKSMPMATSDLPIIIIEFGQQRQRIKLNKYLFNINELLEIFSKTFQISFNLNKYDILLFNKRLDLLTKLDFTQLNNYQRFKIQINNNNQTDKCHSSTVKSEDEFTSLKQRINTASTEIKHVSSLINSICKNYQNLIKTLINEENQSNDNHVHLSVPPGFKPLSKLNQKHLNISPQNSQSTDEGIDRDVGSISVFESAHSDYEIESVYLECREDLTIINEPNPISINHNSKLEWRNQPYQYRPQWNSKKIQHQPNYNRDQFGDKPRVKKPININKAPLPPEKKKNIPCKYAAGGNCKRGSQCRFIHVV
ncbi:unnamed protein product [Adineta steineri]|uniref:C3H1-type domain-containing protein n=2 Tax=Bdelloidea TaxID=44578 RepID=A0A813U7C9_9BILA|nr:unnamed protein product [Adineta steineri]CAF1007584.1 unnamed protein product [Adineta steineri]CAF1016894.1 unnamed protein product [Adineta steineri]